MTNIFAASTRFAPLALGMALALGPLTMQAQAAEDSDLVTVTPQKSAERPAAVDDTANAEDRKGSILDNFHGQVGAMIGTHGARAVFGTAAIPLGEKGGLVISFESSQYDYRR